MRTKKDKNESCKECFKKEHNTQINTRMKKEKKKKRQVKAKQAKTVSTYSYSSCCKYTRRYISCEIIFLTNSRHFRSDYLFPNLPIYIHNVD